MATQLDADTLAAFAGHSLSAGEESGVFAHLAECGACRDCLAVSAELPNFHLHAAKKRQNRPLRSTFSPSFRIAAGIAFAVATLATSEVSLNDLPARPSIDRQPIIKNFARNGQPSWRKLSFQKLATHDLLAARNSQRFLNEVNLATVSFPFASSTAAANDAPAANQIVVKTILGERWITVEGLWETPRDRSQQ